MVPNEPNCYYCGKEFGMGESRLIIRKAVKPPRTPYRFIRIGSMCEICEAQNKECQ